MKRFIIVLAAILFLLAGCQTASVPDQTESILSTEHEIVHTPPPQSISLYSLEELNQLKAVAKAKDEDKLQEAAHANSLKSTNDIVEFLSIIESIPVLRLLDGEIIYIGYDWPILENETGNENLGASSQNLGIAYITIKAKDGSWFRVNYWLMNRNAPIEDILKSSDRDTSLLKTPIQAINNRCLVHHETRENHNDGEVITWRAVVDGVPVRIKYYTESINAAKAETVFQNATIGAIS